MLDFIDDDTEFDMQPNNQLIFKYIKYSFIDEHTFSFFNGCSVMESK